MSKTRNSPGIRNQESETCVLPSFASRQENNGGSKTDTTPKVFSQRRIHPRRGISKFQRGELAIYQAVHNYLMNS